MAALNIKHTCCRRHFRDQIIIWMGSRKLVNWRRLPFERCLHVAISSCFYATLPPYSLQALLGLSSRGLVGSSLLRKSGFRNKVVPKNWDSANICNMVFWNRITTLSSLCWNRNTDIGYFALKNTCVCGSSETMSRLPCFSAIEVACENGFPTPRFRRILDLSPHIWLPMPVDLRLPKCYPFGSSADPTF